MAISINSSAVNLLASKNVTAALPSLIEGLRPLNTDSISDRSFARPNPLPGSLR
jgi:hypothetical protein